MPLLRPRAQRDPSPMAARARSALACPSGADLRGHDDAPLLDAEVVSLTDDGGRPTLLCTPTSPLLTHAARRDVVRLRVTSGVRGSTSDEDGALDVLEVSGRLVLGGSEGCGRCPEEHRLVVLEPAAVTLRVQGRTVPVPVEDFLGTEHALNRGYLQRAAEHATACHGEELRRVDFHSSHEALLMEYEHAMTRVDSRTEQPYNVSGPFVWIGERTRQLDGAHVEYFRHIRNPIGVKLGPTATADDALALAAQLNPENTPGRLTFITRFGADKVREGLPGLVEKVTAEGVQVAWVCDPMHGNTFTSSTGYKTRRLDDVVGEVQGFFDVHRSLGTWPGGILVEMTGDDVTECIGGGEELDEHGLAHRYESVVDPRLNRVQSLELAFQVADMLRAVSP